MSPEEFRFVLDQVWSRPRLRSMIEIYRRRCNLWREAASGAMDPMQVRRLFDLREEERLLLGKLYAQLEGAEKDPEVAPRKVVKS